MTETTNFAQWFRVELARRNWTQADFVRESELLGEPVTGTTVSKWAQGRTQPSTRSCVAIAKILKQPLTEVQIRAGHVPTLNPALAEIAQRLDTLPDTIREHVEEHVHQYLDVVTENLTAVSEPSASYISDRQRLVDRVLRADEQTVRQLLAIIDEQ